VFVTDICFDSQNWNDLCARVMGAGIDLEALARETAALRRRRHVRDAQTLLRLALAYGGGPGSLQTAGSTNGSPSRTPNMPRRSRCG